MSVSDGRDIVRLQLPALGAYLSVLRSATAGLAARLDDIHRQGEWRFDRHSGRLVGGNGRCGGQHDGWDSTWRRQYRLERP